ncbi:hypothetical protein E2C01_048819 [Portunus trituberculatus]|uniref:Uncharacterized protein n=2 Tax=Portunus trituberculatus TaxID=210409 RepID=A0A5B7G428_PORTR|nr:hypothetical protein [Portunus trituberculatus]
MAEVDKMHSQITQLSAAKDQILTLEEKCRNLEKMSKSRQVLGKQHGHQPEDQEIDVMETNACKEMIHGETHSYAGTVKKSGEQTKALVCEDCTQYKSLVERLNRLVEEKETEHEKKMAEVAVHHSKSFNASSLFDTSGNTSTHGTKKNRMALMEQKNDILSVQLVQYYEKVKRLEETLENMRRTNGVISQDMEVQRELSWMWEKMQEAEKKLKLLNKNYDLLEIENEELRKSQEQQATEKKTEAEENMVLEMQKRCNAAENKYMLLQEEYKVLVKFKSVGNDVNSQEHYDSLKSSHDSLQDELHSLQKKYSALHENYTTLQETYDTLQETHRMLQEIHSSVQAAHNILQETYNTLQDKYSSACNKFEELQEKYNALLKAQNSSSDSSHENALSNQELQCHVVTGKPPVGVVAAVTSHSEGDLRECLAAAERENDELKLRLMANDAPSRKKVELLTQELRIAERKISQLKGELRRQQEANRGDSTIYELTDQSKQQQEEEGKGKAEPDYSSGSSIVTQVVVMELQNKLYHTEKDKKKLENELKVVQQHVDHYQTKAREWKVKATKFEQAAQKATKERDEMYSELKKYEVKIEELSSKLERQQFELGHQRELIQKMEKEVPSSISAASATPGFVEVPRVTPASRESRGAPVTPLLAATAGGIGKCMMVTPGTVEGPGIETEGNTSSVSGRTDKGRDNDKQMQDERPATRLLGLHNAPLSYHTRAEKLPFMKDIRAKETRDEVPMWKKSRKENEDIKYRLPPEERRKPSEDCKTQ